jgi:hypothetical protein
MQKEKLTRMGQLVKVYRSFLKHIHSTMQQAQLDTTDLTQLIDDFETKATPLLVCAHAQDMIDRYGSEIKDRKDATIFKFVSELNKSSNATNLAEQAIGFVHELERNADAKNLFWKHLDFIKKIIESP